MSELIQPQADVRERDWLVPGALMTAGLGAAALILMPIAGYDHIPDYFGRFLTWLNYSLVGALFLLLLQVVALRRAGVDDPIAHLKARVVEKRGLLLAAVTGMSLAGIDMLFFMWIKPEVTAIAPFRADAALARIDHAMFGTDPWRLFQGIDLTFHAWAYSFFWAVAIMATLVWLLAQRPSAERSASLLSYFALWSIFGPIGQYLCSAAGPIFYERVGLGDRFADLTTSIPVVTQRISDYLWNFHTTGTLGVGAGVSAMPSLHIATVMWIVLAFFYQRSRLTPLTALFALYIFALSVALGWHYAIDGIAGAAGAVVSHLLCRRYIKGRAASWASTPILAPAA